MRGRRVMSGVVSQYGVATVIRGQQALCSMRVKIVE